MVNLIVLNLLTAAAIDNNIGLEQAETILLETRVQDMASGLSKANTWSLVEGDQDAAKSPPKVSVLLFRYVGIKINNNANIL